MNTRSRRDPVWKKKKVDKTQGYSLASTGVHTHMDVHLSTWTCVHIHTYTHTKPEQHDYSYWYIVHFISTDIRSHGSYIKNRNLTSVDVQCSNSFMAIISQYFIHKTIMSYFLNTHFGWRWNTSEEVEVWRRGFYVNTQSMGAWPLELQLARHQAPELLSLILFLPLCPSPLPFHYIPATYGLIERKPLLQPLVSWESGLWS